MKIVLEMIQQAGFVALKDHRDVCQRKVSLLLLGQQGYANPIGQPAQTCRTTHAKTPDSKDETFKVTTLEEQARTKCATKWQNAC